MSARTEDVYVQSGLRIRVSRNGAQPAVSVRVETTDAASVVIGDAPCTDLASAAARQATLAAMPNAQHRVEDVLAALQGIAEERLTPLPNLTLAPEPGAVARNGKPTREGRVPQGTQLVFRDPEPWPEPVDGAAWLTECADLFSNHCVLPPGGADTAALFSLFTYLHDVAAVLVSPKLLITAPTKRAGKTTLLTLLGAVVRRPCPASNVTAAPLFRVIEKYAPTLLLDEGDTFLGENEELRGILNSGHTRATAFVIRSSRDDHEPRAFSTWAPQVIAMIKLPPDTIRDRSVPIVMERKAPGDRVERLRTDLLANRCLPLRRQAVRWAEDAAARIGELDPVVPAVLDDRQQDNWRPLLAIADIVGGDWPERARAAALATSGAHAEDDSAGIQCLAAIRQLFDDRAVDRLASADIVTYLIGIEDGPWADWKGKGFSPNSLARLLKPFRIKPKSIRVDASDTPKGYLREWFARPFERYLPTPQTATAATTLPHNELRSAQTATEKNRVAVSRSANSLGDNDVAAVAVAAPGNGRSTARVAGATREEGSLL